MQVKVVYLKIVHITLYSIRYLIIQTAKFIINISLQDLLHNICPKTNKENYKKIYNIIL